MTVTAPPRPPSARDPVDRAELEALVEALIEEARLRARRRRQRYAGAALLALLAGFALYVGLAHGGKDRAPGAPAPRPQAAHQTAGSSLSFRLLSIETSIRMVDHPPKGKIGKGDAIYVKDELRNGWADQFGRPRNALVGHDTWTRTGIAKPGWELVKVKVWLPGGTLRLQAKGQFSGTIHFRVVGGTGRYAKARGTMLWQSRTAPSLNDYALRLAAR